MSKYIARQSDDDMLRTAYVIGALFAGVAYITYLSP